MVQDFLIPVAQDEEAPSGEPSVAPLVIIIRAVLASVSLDEQPAFEAHEVGDEGTERDLTAEL